jgi:hypothetical protein
MLQVWRCSCWHRVLREKHVRFRQPLKYLTRMLRLNPSFGAAGLDDFSLMEAALAH